MDWVNLSRTGGTDCLGKTGEVGLEKTPNAKILRIPNQAFFYYNFVA